MDALPQSRPQTSAGRDAACQVGAVEVLPPPMVVSGTRPRDSHCQRVVPLVQSGELMRRSSAAAKDRAASRALQDGDELRLRDWLECRPATCPPQSSASQRWQAIRDRLSGKLRPCGCRVLSPQCDCA